MYKRLSDYRDQFVEIVQAHPSGRLWYTGRMISLDQETVGLQFYDAAGIEDSTMFFPICTILGLAVNTEDSLAVEARVMGRKEQVQALRKAYEQEIV